ncbi:MAG: GH3 auxin-responsive promoter family protein, partial [Saprospiraceae bacterium]
SGTTSGVKYIPLTKDSLPNHFGTAKNAIFNYAARSGNFDFFNGKIIFLSGSPALEEVNGIKVGRLSGIVNHQVPAWLRKNQVPSFKTNCLEDWEEKLEAIVLETVKQDMRLISGIPPWVQMYYERLLAKTGKDTVLEVFPNYSVFGYGGVNFEPYRKSLESLVGAKIDSVETYPASEGFIAFQDQPGEPGLLLNVDSGIFFEFVPVSELGSANPSRYWLGEVEIGVQYAVIINNNAGLFGYSIGDTIQFISLNPYRILVSGRVKHFISAFGEHVIGKEVDTALSEACVKHNCQVTEFTVAPQVSPGNNELPYHEWFIEFEREPADLAAFAISLDEAMIKQNIYYEDLIKGKILQSLIVRKCPAQTFIGYMRSQGKLGGQNKVPHLSNDRKLVDLLKM